MPISPPLLELRGLAKAFGPVTALRGIDLELQPGEVHALLGENGAGKSTLIKLVTGAYQPDEGSITIAGRRVRHLDPATARSLGVACIYQQPALFPDLTVAENIDLRLEPPRPWRRVDWAASRLRAKGLLERIGATIDPGTHVRALSMPEQQLVEVACALGSSARIVIMDEPTVSLTQQEQHLLFAVVRNLRASGAGVLYISHRLEEIFALADRVTVLRDGDNIGTCRVSDVTEAGLIRMMIGREVSQLYPAGTGARGKVVLTLHEVGCAVSGVRGVNLDVHEGEVFGLAGLVGAGRTGLARVLFGLTPADAGEIRVCGKAVTLRTPREAIARGIACVPEDRRRHGIVAEISVVQNITMAIHRRLFPSGWLRRGAERALAGAYMRELGVKAASPDTPVADLSGGNQQKVALARWLAAGPRLLILDEPTQGVDIGAKSEIHRIIRNLAKDGLAVLLISSDLPEILGMSDRIGVMRGGTIVATLPGQTTAERVMAAALGQAEEKLA